MRTVGTILFTCLLSLSVVAQDPSAKKSEFDYLDVSGSVVRTTHDAKYRIYISESFRFLGILNHKAVYNEVGFNISIAVFSRADELILIHAEKHTDGSGGLDYSDLAPAKLDGLPFTRRTQCATAEDKEELDANPQIRFIREKGVDLTLPFQLEQYLATSKNGASEIVISHGKPVQDCSESIGRDLREKLDYYSKVSLSEFDSESNRYFLKLEIPFASECAYRVGPAGLVPSSDACIYGAGIERYSEVTVTIDQEKKGWSRVVVASSDPDEKAYLILASPDKETFDSLFSIFFTKRDTEVASSASCKDLQTQLDVLRELGIPSQYHKRGALEIWDYGLDRPFNCADYTQIRFKDGKVIEIGVVL